MKRIWFLLMGMLFNSMGFCNWTEDSSIVKVFPATRSSTSEFSEICERFEVAPWFKAIQPDLLQFIKQSYVLTKRTSAKDFVNEHLLLQETIDGIVSETGHRYYRDRNFTGIQGKIEATSCCRAALCCCVGACTGNLFAGEIDFPGFVSLLEPNQDCPYYVINIVFRGSQGEKFQDLSGILGSSWISNFDSDPLEVDPNNFGFEGAMHAGYLTKIGYCNANAFTLESLVIDEGIDNPIDFANLRDAAYPLNVSIKKVIRRVPAEHRGNIRFVITGHSQGAGLAQVALPYIIKKFGHKIPGFIDNVNTPRFFGYFLSAPRVAANEETAESYTTFVGQDNMINHGAFRDIVTIAALDSYVTLGRLAFDSVYDVLYRGVASEIAHNNRILLIKFLKRRLNKSLFNTRNDDYWVLRENPNLIICWKELQSLMTYKQFKGHTVTKEIMLGFINDALMQFRERRNIDCQDIFDSSVQDFLKDGVNWFQIEAICRGDLTKEDIVLDHERCKLLKEMELNVSGATVSYSKSGQFNFVSLIDTAFDLLEASGEKIYRGGNFGEFFRRVFCCSCCCGSNPSVSVPYYFDPEFRELVLEDFIDPREYKITPAGSVSLFVYLHYGSSANGEDSKLFDKFLPSRNLEHALMNGSIVNHSDNINLYSEIPITENDYYSNRTCMDPETSLLSREQPVRKRTVLEMSFGNSHY